MVPEFVYSGCDYGCSFGNGSQWYPNGRRVRPGGVAGYGSQVRGSEGLNEILHYLRDLISIMLCRALAGQLQSIYNAGNIVCVLLSWSDKMSYCEHDSVVMEVWVYSRTMRTS